MRQQLLETAKFNVNNFEVWANGRLDKAYNEAFLNFPGAFTEPTHLPAPSKTNGKMSLAVKRNKAGHRRETEMVLINNVGRTLASAANLDEALSHTLEQIKTVLNAESGFLFLTDPATGDLICQTGLDAGEIKSFRVARGQGLTGQVALTGQPQRATAKKGKLDFEAKNMICTPLILREKIIGVIEFINKKEGDFTPHDLTLLDSLAYSIALAVDNSRLQQCVLAEQKRTIETETETRKTLAGDLHDGPVQLVAGLLMRVDFCRMLLEKDPAQVDEELIRAKELGEQAMHQMRTMLFELRPLLLKTEGLEAALRAFVAAKEQDIVGEQSTNLTLEIETEQPDGHLSRRDEKIETAMFAIVQETVNNALKHAQADNIVVQLKENHAGLHLTIKDDGTGFDVKAVMKNYGQQRSLGMINLQERAELIGSEFSIISTLGQGTAVKVFVPQPKPEHNNNGRVLLPLALLEQTEMSQVSV